MKKITYLFAIGILIILLNSPIYANPCGDYDYSELKDMNEKELLKTYCKELKITKLYINAYMNASINSRYHRNEELDYKSCNVVIDKIERVYMKKTKNQMTHQDLLNRCGSINMTLELEKDEKR